jgi:hypothetical protein
MTLSKQIFIGVLTILLTSCGSQTNKKVYEHNYTKYWDKYKSQQLIDTLYSDTLLVSGDRSFYVNTTQDLIADIEDDNKIDSLYPMAAFDEVSIKKLPWGFKKVFTETQINRFLAIINDPVSFDWSETTYEAEYQVNFSKDNKVVASLTIGADKSIIKTSHNWPQFKKMKFGHLKSARHNDLIKLIDDI